MKLLRKITDKTAGILTLYFSISILIVLNLLQQLFLNSFIINVILSTLLILNTAILAYDSLTTNRFMERVISFFKNSDKSNIDYFSIKESGKFEVFAENINIFIDNSVKHSKEQQNYLKSISEMAESITESTREVGKSIEQVTATIYEIAKGSSEQSTSMQETAELIEMVSEAIEEVTRNSNQVGRDAGKSAELIGESKAVVDDLQINTKHIVEITEQISLTTNEMNDKSEAINGIVKIITSIASQTNLLALNAAIEAARAGEAGKGFSVVAAEIRSLAEQSSKSANEIASIISNSLNDTKQVTEKMKEATAIIESQVGIIDKIDEVFNGMADTVNSFARKMKSSGNTLEEVNNAITEINNQAQNVASIIESNAAATEEVSAASQEQQGIFESIADQISSLAEMSKVK